MVPSWLELEINSVTKVLVHETFVRMADGTDAAVAVDVVCWVADVTCVGGGLYPSEVCMHCPCVYLTPDLEPHWDKEEACMRCECDLTDPSCEVSDSDDEIS